MTPAVVWDVLDLNLLWQIKYLGDKRSAGYNFIVRDNAHRADFTFFRADNMPILERRGSGRFERRFTIYTSGWIQSKVWIFKILIF